MTTQYRRSHADARLSDREFSQLMAEMRSGKRAETRPKGSQLVTKEEVLAESTMTLSLSQVPRDDIRYLQSTSHETAFRCLLGLPRRDSQQPPLMSRHGRQSPMTAPSNER